METRRRTEEGGSAGREVSGDGRFTGPEHGSQVDITAERRREARHATWRRTIGQTVFAPLSLITLFALAAFRPEAVDVLTVFVTETAPQLLQIFGAASAGALYAWRR